MSLPDRDPKKSRSPAFALQQQFAYITSTVEALRNTQVASGIAIEELFEGLMRREFAGELVA